MDYTDKGYVVLNQKLETRNQKQKSTNSSTDYADYPDDINN